MARVLEPVERGGRPGDRGGEPSELVTAIRAGLTHVNVHTTNFPNGELRGQIRKGGGDDDD